jgi:tRNA nucleotidyltransferase (CCA-adding enzyme)
MSVEQLDFDIPGPVERISSRLAAAGESAYVVGGSMRDLLTGRAPVDWDVATTATPERVIELFERVIPTGIDHGTVTVLLGGQSVEVTTLRGDGAYSDGRHPDEVEFVSDIEQDLERRDFTINAIAWDPATRTLHDPFAGREDLDRGLIRAVRDPASRFAEDGLRVLRAARFAAVLEFDVEPETAAAMPGAASMLANVSVERKRDELIKTLKAERPSIGLDLMAKTGLLPHLAPELARLKDRKPAGPGPADAWSHTVARVDRCPAAAHLRLAALLYDLAREPDDDKATDRAGTARPWLVAMKLDRRTRDRATHLLSHHGLSYRSSWTDTDLRRAMRRLGREHFRDLIDLEEADRAALGDADEAIEDFAELRGRVAGLEAGPLALAVSDLALGGDDLLQDLGMDPGPAVGALLEALVDHVVENPHDNSKQRLLEVARSIKDKS